MENNKLIAEFMGDIPKYVIGNGKAYNKYKDYSKSWDWLMPVVSKITRDEQYWEDDYREHLMDIVPYGHIEDTYSAVVEFIKEHNVDSEDDACDMLYGVDNNQ